MFGTAVNFPASRGPFSFVFAELTDRTKSDLCQGSKLPLIQPPSMVVDGGFQEGVMNLGLGTSAGIGE